MLLLANLFRVVHLYTFSNLPQEQVHKCSIFFTQWQFMLEREQMAACLVKLLTQSEETALIYLNEPVSFKELHQILHNISQIQMPPPQTYMMQQMQQQPEVIVQSVDKDEQQKQLVEEEDVDNEALDTSA